MFKLQTFSGLHLINTHTTNSDKKRYRGLKGLFILVYLALEEKTRQDVPHLAEFIFVKNTSAQNSFDRALSNLKIGLDLDIPPVDDSKGKKRRKKAPLPHFMIEGISPRNCRSLGLDSSYLTHHSDAADKNGKPMLYVDMLALECACKTGDLAAIAAIYQGPFLAGFEEEIKGKKYSNTGRASKETSQATSDQVTEKTPKASKEEASQETSGEKPAYLKWIEDKRRDFADLVLEEISKLLEKHPSGHPKAEELLRFILDSHDIAFLSTGFLAFIYTLLPKDKQHTMRSALVAGLEKQPAKGYLHVLYAMALQKNASLSLACSACKLNAQESAELAQVYAEHDWINEHNPDYLINGHGFLHAALNNIKQRPTKYALLHELFALTPAQNHNELFHLAWAYQQDTGNFGDMSWTKICQVLAFQVREYCRYGKFAKAQNVCEAWEQARAQREEKPNEDLHFYHAYSLERQSYYPQAWEVLSQQLHVKSIRHQVLQVCLHERMSTLELSEMQIQHLYPHIAAMLEQENSPQDLLDSLYAQTGLSSNDDWARAEIHSIKGRISFQQQNYPVAIGFFQKALAAWQECHEPYRELGVRNNIACAYDKAKNPDAALTQYQLIDTELEKYPQFGQLVFRNQLNQIILRERHDYEDVAMLSQRYQQLIDSLKECEQDFPNILGESLYNAGYCKQQAGYFQDALALYHEAMPILSRNKDKVTFGCAYGEIGNCYYNLLKHHDKTPLDTQRTSTNLAAKYMDKDHLINCAHHALETAIDILGRINHPYTKDYRNTLSHLENLKYLAAADASKDHLSEYPTHDNQKIYRSIKE